MVAEPRTGHADFEKRLAAPDAGEDFGVIWAMWKRYEANKMEDNLPYFALAARCHVDWIRRKLDAHFRGDFPTWVQVKLVYDPIVWKGFVLPAAPKKERKPLPPPPVPSKPTKPALKSKLKLF